jgi:hypothetical protein
MNTIIVNDAFQTDYRYTRTAPTGKQFREDFTPDLTPQDMLELGVFGGVYLNDCRDEFPKSWFVHAKLSDGEPDASCNFFQVFASQPLRVWIEKGWIHPDDPRGWFQWYARYYMGRRHSDDDRQIKRWKAIVRHRAQIQKHCHPGDWGCRPVQRQALLQWAYDSRGV